MSHNRGRSSSAEGKLFNVFRKQTTTTKQCQSLDRLTADSKELCSCNHTDGHKMKRLKTRKERSQMRAVWKESFKLKLHHQHCQRHCSTCADHFHNCCHSTCHCPSMRHTQFPSVPVAQEPSIITGSRLIGHQGLFNHEVKSADIERLLSEQKKGEDAVQQEKNSKKARSLSSEGVAAIHNDDQSDLDVETASKANDECHLKTNKRFRFSHESLEITPGQKQKTQLQLDLSAGSANSMISYKQSPFNAEATTSLKTSDAAAEKERSSNLTSIVDRKAMEGKVKEDVISTPEQNQNNLEIPILPIQAGGLRPSPLHLSSSPTAESFAIQNRKQDPESVSERVCTMAARLCVGLQYFSPGKNNLVSASKELLLKSLQERHGLSLQENLLQLRETTHLDVDSSKATRDLDHDNAMIDDDDVFPTGTFDKMTKSRHVNAKSISALNQSAPHAAEWLTTAMDTSVGVFDEIIHPSSSSPFCMAFEPFKASASDSLTSFPSSCQDVSEFNHWQDTFNRSNSKEPPAFDLFDNSFKKQGKSFTKQRNRAHTHGSWKQNELLFSDQELMPDQYSSDPKYFPQEQDPFGSVTCSSSNSVFAQISHPSQGSHRHAFTKHYQSSTWPPQRPQHTDMTLFPPSHMLERDSATPSSLFPSPEQWSFPPMRLY